MMIKKTLATLVGISLVGAPVVAQAAAAPAARTGSPVAEGENIQGGWFLPVLAILAVLLGIVVMVDNGDDLPTSP
jgi:hypothetical protein